MALHEYVVQEVALDCAEGLLSRREAIRRLGLLGLSAAASSALLAACGSDESADPTTSPASTASTASATVPTVPATSVPASSAAASTAPPTSGSTAPATASGEEVRFAGPSGELIGAWSAAAAPRGAVLIIHENKGLTAHIRSIPPRLAADGYSALAIDLLSEEGGTASMPSEGDATAALGNAPAARMVADLRAGLDELQRRAPGVKLAVVGFCFGGGMTWQLLAAGEPRLAAAVPFYGPFPDGATFTGSPNAAVLGLYGGLDARVTGTKDAADAALTAAGLAHELKVFDGADHAFFNDTGPRYNADAAKQAYQAVLDWFSAHVG